MLFSRKNVIDVAFRVFDKGLDKLVCLSCSISRSPKKERFRMKRT